MNTEQRPNRGLWIFGILLLVVTGLGAVLNYSPGHDSYTDGRDKDGSPPPPIIICTGMIDVDPGVAQLYPLQTGRVVEVVPEGKVAKKGEVLLRLDNRQAQYKLNEAKADLEAAKDQLASALLLPEQHKLKKVQQQAAINAAEGQYAATNEEYKIRKEAEEETKKKVSAGYEKMLEKLDAVIKGEQAKLNELKLFDNQPKLDISRAKAAVAAKEALVKQAEWALEECDLVAPEDGTVLRVLVNRGEVLGPNARTAAIQFCPAGPKIVRAEVLQEWAAGVKEGQEVTIEDDTYAAAQWRGKVKRLSEWFSDKRHKIPEPFMTNDVRTMECLVEITSDAPNLRIGQRVRVKIKQGS